MDSPGILEKWGKGLINASCLLSWVIAPLGPESLARGWGGPAGNRSRPLLEARWWISIRLAKLDHYKFSALRACPASFGGSFATFSDSLHPPCVGAFLASFVYWRLAITSQLLWVSSMGAVPALDGYTCSVRWVIRSAPLQQVLCS